MKELTRDASLAQYITIAFNAELDKRQTEFYLSNIEVEMIKRNFCALSSLEDDKLIIDIDLNSFEVSRNINMSDIFKNLANEREGKKKIDVRLSGETDFCYKFIHSQKPQYDGYKITIFTADDDSNKFGNNYEYTNDEDNLKYLEMSIDEKIEIIFSFQNQIQELYENQEKHNAYLDSLTPNQLAKHWEKEENLFYERQEMEIRYRSGEIGEWEYEEWKKKMSIKMQNLRKLKD